MRWRRPSTIGVNHGDEQGDQLTTFRQLLDQFEESAKTRSAKGRRFEWFCEAFFRTDPYWSERLDEVWAWADWPGRDNRNDTGIDLVVRERGHGPADRGAVQVLLAGRNSGGSVLRECIRNAGLLNQRSPGRAATYSCHHA